MLKQTLLYFFLLLLCFAQAQKDALNLLDDQGRKQGLWEVKYTNGNIKFTGKFIDDVPVDTFRYFYESGPLKAILVHQKNVSYETAYYADSTLMSKGKYISRKKDGDWKYYFKTGTLVLEETYKDGEKNGATKEYNAEGVLLRELNYVNGLREGAWLQYYVDGKKHIQSNYANDSLNGWMKIYNQAGVIRVSGQYKGNLKEGTWMYFNDQMQTVRREEYKAGKLIKEEQYIKQESPFDGEPLQEQNNSSGNSLIMDDTGY